MGKSTGSKKKAPTSPVKYDPNPSAELDRFLSWLRDVKTEREMAIDDEKEADSETQDILHAIEFGNAKKTPSAVMRILRKTRAKRRAAKVYSETVDPIIVWAADNGRVINALEKVLGDMRKAENRASSRIYTPRTSILEE